MLIDGVPTRIVGIMPRGFDLHDERIEIYLPLKQKASFWAGRTACCVRSSIGTTALRARLGQRSGLCLIVGKISPVEIFARIAEQLQEHPIQKTDQKAELFERRRRWWHVRPLLGGPALAIELAGVNQVVPAQNE